MVETVEDGLILLDAAGVVLYVNRSAERVCGLARDAVVGRRLRDLPRGPVDWAVATEASEGRVAVAALQPLGDRTKLFVSARPVRAADGSDHVVITLRDATDASDLMGRLQQKAGASRQHGNGLVEPAGRPLIARSVVMRAARDLAMRYAATDLPVLILGETGTGKGLFAELIHGSSRRANGPFLELNCGAIPEALMETELFGYARGAFTGADMRGKPGLVELAEGGTLLLDEIGELPPGLQAKLLRFLESGEIRPVGATRTRRPEVRIVAATNRDLSEMVARGAFRADLFYRLDVLGIRLPPLREHPEDVADLVGLLLARLERRIHRRLAISPAALARLSRYAFPGNVRELANIIDRIGVVVPGDTIEVEDLPPEIASAGDFGIRPGMTRPLRDAVRRVETVMLRDALERFGTQERAARHLGVGQATVARKLKRYGLDGPPSGR